MSPRRHREQVQWRIKAQNRPHNWAGEDSFRGTRHPALRTVVERTQCRCSEAQPVVRNDYGLFLWHVKRPPLGRRPATSSRAAEIVKQQTRAGAPVSLSAEPQLTVATSIPRKRRRMSATRRPINNGVRDLDARGCFWAGIRFPPQAGELISGGRWGVSTEGVQRLMH